MTLLLLALSGALNADPCGMVPPIVTSGSGQLVRDGAQRTYVMHTRGIETMALRPGFVGDVEQFGMLIPFPTPPAIRKIEDDTFAHIEAAVDPPQVTVEVYDPWVEEEFDMFPSMAMEDAATDMEGAERALGYNEVNVLRQEAVGMYQVAVLEAGSPKALSRWMGDNGYQYPDGMDAVVSEYVAASWCFVAVKAQVDGNQGATPHPGMRSADNRRPAGSSFDGHVQGMGFRFETPEPVVPMRLSVFNGEAERNVVYMLTDSPVKIDDLPETLVDRQVPGEELFGHLSDPLPIRWLYGKRKDVRDADWERIQPLRDPEPYNGIARVLFSADLLAARTGELSLPFEEEEKELLRISEAMGLRGEQIDTLHLGALQEARSLAVEGALDDVKEMHLTVLDGDFDVEVLARQNLTFSTWRMPAHQNTERADPIKVEGPYTSVERKTPNPVNLLPR